MKDALRVPRQLNRPTTVTDILRAELKRALVAASLIIDPQSADTHAMTPPKHKQLAIAIPELSGL